MRELSSNSMADESSPEDFQYPMFQYSIKFVQTGRKLMRLLSSHLHRNLP